MMNPHHGARLTVHGREQIGVFSGQPAADVAAAFAVSLRRVRTWLARFSAGRPAKASVALILHLRRSLQMTGAAITARPGLARLTLARGLGFRACRGG